MIRTLVMTSALALAALMAAAPSRAQAQASIEIEAEGPVIELVVTDRVQVAPDFVRIGAGVSSEAPTAIEAMRNNAAEMTRVIDRLKELGVEAEDIRTTRLDLNARYEYEKDTRKRTFAGYTASNRVRVKLTDIEETGKTLDALIAAGATDVSGPDFGIENDENAKLEARERAVARAEEQAQAYAAMLGSDEIRVLTIAEDIAFSETDSTDYIAEGFLREFPAALPPVEPGMVSVRVTVSLAFEVIEQDAESDSASDDE